jgi:hypothetical protein
MRKGKTVFGIVLVTLVISMSGCAKSKVSGAAWVTRGNGSSDPLRGLEVAVCKTDLLGDLRQVIETGMKASKEEYPTIKNDFYHLPLAEMGETVMKHAVATGKADIDGKFTIPNVPTGKYFLYAQLQTSFSKIYWLVPVKVGWSEVHIDLDNSNAAAIYNKNDDE